MTGPQPLVLIVDDNERNVKLARDLLVLDGLRTIEAGTGADGLALAAARLPDAILMDLHLPDMPGTEAARRLAADPRTSAIPVIALSALATDDLRDVLRAGGFAGELAKPVDVTSFAAQVRRFCGEGGA